MVIEEQCEEESYIIIRLQMFIYVQEDVIFMHEMQIYTKSLV